MKTNIIQTIKSKEKVSEERIQEARNGAQNFIKQTQERAKQIIAQAKDLADSAKAEIIKLVGEKALAQISQDKKNHQSEIKELTQISPIKREKAINLIISKILE